MSVKFAVFICLSLGLCNAQSDCTSLNNCNSHGQCHNGACVCHSDWGGPDCSLSTNGCPSFCFGHGTCLNGICECDHGFAGDACNIVVSSCPNNCTGHGLCVAGQCNCIPGLWTGDACDKEVYSCPSNLNNCTGRGRCEPSDPQDATSVWHCACESGFCGESCNVVCGNCPNNCTGHGICQGGLCKCETGFSGSDCGQVAPVSSCPNNCTGHGRCRKTQGVFSCQCDSCYSGEDCSLTTKFCPGNCSTRGLCDCDGKCHCQPGYAGPACEEVVSLCEHLSYCSGNGRCVNNTCKCNPGFAGSTCNLACHTGALNNTVGCHAHKNQGQCVERSNLTAVCVCRPEYTGVGCEEETSDGLIDPYLKGWNPLGTAIIAVLGAVVVSVVIGLVVNYARGLRGVNALPGISAARSKVTGTEYVEAPSQRNHSDY